MSGLRSAAGFVTGRRLARAPAAEDGAPLPDVLDALTEFETWYGETHPNPFWMLFENQMPETPLVDF